MGEPIVDEARLANTTDEGVEDPRHRARLDAQRNPGQFNKFALERLDAILDLLGAKTDSHDPLAGIADRLDTLIEVNTANAKILGSIAQSLQPSGKQPGTPSDKKTA